MSAGTTLARGFSRLSAWVLLGFLFLPLLVVIPVALTDQDYLSCRLGYWTLRRALCSPIRHGSALPALHTNDDQKSQRPHPTSQHLHQRVYLSLQPIHICSKAHHVMMIQ